MRRRILFVPATMPSHMIPLMALARQLPPDEFECAFLLPGEYHAYARSIGFTVMQINRKLQEKTTPEMMAIVAFDPHVIVDDLSYTTAYSSRMANIPRVAIIRRGLFPFETPMPGYRHTCPYIESIVDRLDGMMLPDKSQWLPSHFSELFIANLHIVPSIPVVDLLPDGLDPQRYRYSGPLLLPDDDLLQSAGYLPLSIGKNGPTLDDFIALNRGRKIVNINLGLTYRTGSQGRVARCVQRLLRRGVAVITNITDAVVDEDCRSLLYADEIVPMHKVCEAADIMIHHCGSGTYNYQLLHRVPAIILGTKNHDRDAIAIRLEELGAARYVSPDLDDGDWTRQFEDAADALLDDGSAVFRRQTGVLKVLGEMITDTQRAFNPGQLIERVAREGISGETPMLRKFS